MVSKFLVLPFFFFFHIFFAFRIQPSEAQSWIKVAYWYSGSEFPISDINSPLFTHLIYAYTDVNSSSYELSSSSSDSSEQYYSTFTPTVKQRNPSVITLVSIGGGNADYGVISTMVGSSSHRKSFIDSSIIFARRYGFLGLDFCWVSANTSSDMANMGKLFEEWRAAIASEASINSQTPLILTAALKYKPDFESFAFPVESIRDNLNWVHVIAYDYYGPQWTNFTGAYAALYDPSSDLSTDYVIKSWIGRGLSASKLVLGLPFYGYAWTLSNPRYSVIGAPAKGPAITEDGSMSYKKIKDYIDRYGADIVYNATYVAKYCVIGSAWIGFDDAEVVKIKVSYAKEQNLLGYFIWQISFDDNWVLSLAAAAQKEGNDHKKKPRLLLVILLPVTSVVILIAFVVCFWQRELLKTRGMIVLGRSRSTGTSVVDSDAPNLKVYRFSSLKAATNNFSSENKLGEGGFGPVYKGKLRRGQEIAVKRLSKTSTQGLQEFENEVKLTARLQHVNLVPVLGFCTENEEKMLVYEYMPNKSLDFYLFDPTRRYFMDWRKRVHIIEGIIQGLLYLQEYSNFTIIHRDLKASNILLDDEMNAKISDFGMAKLFRKDELEGNTKRIVGTVGYVPPEYVRKGVYSMKYDVYSFGVLLLQMISGRKSSHYYGPNESMHLLEYAYVSWKEDKGLEFIDPSLDDSSSSCKLLRCLQVALLCVQENADDRPTMLEVYSMLKSDTQAVPTPTKTAFSVRNYDNVDHICIPQPGVCSVNDAEISELQPR